jgi:phosphoribosylformylglycinamidine synthase
MNIQQLALNLGLSLLEYNLIVDRLGREPNEFETYLFSAQWSEHCGYKHSKYYLKKLNSSFESENAGYVEIGDKAIVFKVESHNHPSAVEPYQGAATGIGGIVRDILAMGARPVALLNSLKFGDLKESKVSRIFKGVVSGISGYGNTIGIPTVAGEISFHETYDNNPLANVMCIGIANKDELISSHADGPDKYMVYVGSKTGPDGVHGASFASKEFGKEESPERPSIQVGDPFAEKNLIEASLEIMKIKGVKACQDMGAAGILSSTSEMANKGNIGCELYLDKVPVRQSDIKPWEIMLSESQERMLFLMEKGYDEQIKSICDKYMLDFAIIGKTIQKPLYRVLEKEHGEVIAELPIDVLVNAPEFHKNNTVPSSFYINRGRKIPTIEKDVDYIIKRILSHPTFGSKKWVYEQFDYQVGTNTLLIPGEADSSAIWLKGTQNAIAVTIDSNELYTYLDPYEGTKNVVYEAARNLISVGAKPLAITDNLNFGNPEENEISWQFEQSIEALISASRELCTPVVSGNVSFYNSYKEKSIYPTPIIGMVGEIEDINKIVTKKFKKINDEIYLIGKKQINLGKIGGSLFLYILNDFIGGEIDTVDPLSELQLHKFILELIDNRIVKSVHDVSKGGLMFSIVETCICSNFGFEGELGSTIEELFGENQGMFIVSVSPTNSSKLEEFAISNNIEFKKLGHVINKEKGINIGSKKFDFDLLSNIYFNSISNILEDHKC